MRFDGTRVFVTGAASGIGAATAELFEKEGAHVVGADVVEKDGIVACDVTDQAAVERAMAEAVDRMGGLDVCVNCVCPGGVDTPLSSGATSSLPADANVDLFGRMMGVLDTGPFMPPGDIAEAIAHLASDAARSVTGTSLVVDRGTLW